MMEGKPSLPLDFSNRNTSVAQKMKESNSHKTLEYNFCIHTTESSNQYTVFFELYIYV